MRSRLSNASAKKSDHSQHLKEGLQKSRLKEPFIWIIAAQDEDTLYDSMTFWGMILSDEVRNTINSDQEFEDWKCNFSSFDEARHEFPPVMLGTFRHGYSLMGCDRCSQKKHLEPIFLHQWCPEPRHSIAIHTVYDKFLDSNVERFFFVLGVNGGVFDAYLNPATTGTLPIGKLILQSKPFRL